MVIKEEICRSPPPLTASIKSTEMVEPNKDQLGWKLELRTENLVREFEELWKEMHTSFLYKMLQVGMTCDLQISSPRLRTQITIISEIL